jgi:predicted PurR-regulated permease PerM
VVLLEGLGTSLAIYVFTCIGLWIAGITPFLWGDVDAIASLIPVVGLSLIMIPSVEHVIRPLFIHGKARIYVVWFFVSILGGTIMFGPLGILYGPLALSI